MVNNPNEIEPKNQIEQQKEKPFIIEKMKTRPLNRRKLIRRTLITAVMAVIFGLIACLTFLYLEPIFSNMIYPPETAEPIIFPEDQDEMTPDEMLSDKPNNINSDLLEDDSIYSIIEQEISNYNFAIDHYMQVDQMMNRYVDELSKSMVVIREYTDEYHNGVYTDGVIIAENSMEFYILADASPLYGLSSFKVELYGGLQFTTQMKHYDPNTKLAIFAIRKSLMSDVQKNSVLTTTLGFSNINNLKGTTVVALGNIQGNSSSLGIGVVTTQIENKEKIDANYDLIKTDISYEEGAIGFLFNLDHKVVGIITNEINKKNENSNIIAYGTSSLRNRIEKMANGHLLPYLGIIGSSVSYEAINDLKVPQGIYVKETVIDSPSMKAGIQQGDIIIAMNGESVLNIEQYSALLLLSKVGDQVKLTIMRQTLVEDEINYQRLFFTMTIEKQGGVESFRQIGGS
jgi:S1-C subfamily serine protease